MIEQIINAFQFKLCKKKFIKKNYHGAEGKLSSEQQLYKNQSFGALHRAEPGRMAGGRQKKF